MKGEGIPFDADLKARYGNSTGRGFGGIIGGPNKLMRRIAQRKLVSRDGDVYRMDARDAQLVLDTWSPPSAASPENRGGSSGGIQITATGRERWG